MRETSRNDELSIKIDLRDLRAESQRSDVLDKYNITASQLAMDITSIIYNEKVKSKIDIIKYAPDNDEEAGRKDAAQIIDSIVLTIASLGGVGGVSVLILKIIDLMKNKFPTTYELESKNGKIKFSGKKMKKEDVAILQSMLTVLEEGGKSSNNDNKTIIIHASNRE